MREIKFRVWDIVKKEMSDPFDLWNLACCDLYLFNPTDRPDSPFKPQSGKNVEIMQFTGLLDKNGKEIYEGDIISYPAWIRPKGSREQTLATVIWHISGYTGKVKGDFAPHDLTGTWQKSKVLGNIWENPELLEVHNV